MQENTFHNFAPGLVLDAPNQPFPARLHCLGEGEHELNAQGSHFFGFVLDGGATLERQNQSPVALDSLMYFSCASSFRLHCSGRVVLWEKLDYQGLFFAGGPVENAGRLAYIDGCTTTMICPPPRLLDPVLNLLCFPRHTRQTMHFHPTHRLGVVIEGRGTCVTPSQASAAKLEPGTVFFIPENSAHCFHTESEEMRLIAFHPDSDTGPTDDNHPMLNRTLRL